LRFFISTIAWLSSEEGPLGPDFPRRFGNDSPGATRAHQPRNRGNQMDEQNREITYYATIVSVSASTTRLGFFMDLCDKIGIHYTQVFGGNSIDGIAL
jgi:hypothetical protein